MSTGIAGASLLAATAVCVAVDLSTPVGTAALLALTCSFSLVHRWPAAVVLAATGWALCTAFVANDVGQVTLALPDLVRLGLYVAGALLCCRLGRAAQ